MSFRGSPEPLNRTWRKLLRGATEESPRSFKGLEPRVGKTLHPDGPGTTAATAQAHVSLGDRVRSLSTPFALYRAPRAAHRKRCGAPRAGLARNDRNRSGRRAALPCPPSPP